MCLSLYALLLRTLVIDLHAKNQHNRERFTSMSSKIIFFISRCKMIMFRNRLFSKTEILEGSRGCSAGVDRQFTEDQIAQVCIVLYQQT